MSGHWTDEFSFTGGAVRDKVTGYFSLVGDAGAENKVPHVVFTAWRSGTWYEAGKKHWSVAGVAVSHEPISQMVAVSQWGEVFCTGSGDTHDEHVAMSAAKRPNERGPLTGVRRIGKSIYVVGMDRQVYRRTGANAWSEIGPSSSRTLKSAEPRGFQAIHGFSEQDIYAVGWDGEMWHYDGVSWHPLPSITKRVLVDVCCAADGMVYACGREGLLIRGRADKWALVDADDIEEDFWSLGWFDGLLFIASLHTLYALGKNGVEQASMGTDTPTTCNRLATDDGVLWSIGAKDVMAFDGKKWTRID